LRASWGLLAGLAVLLGCASPGGGDPEGSRPLPTEPAAAPPAAPAAPAPRRPAPRAVWIDVDVAAGVPQRDIDDAVALVQALHSPELRVVGVSTVFGNTTLEAGDPIAREIVGLVDPTVPVYRGAASAEQLGLPTDASIALAAALREQPLTVLVLGPVTNLGTVLTIEPELAGRVELAVAVAGRRRGQRFTTGTTNRRGHRDFNFEKDPAAMVAILDSGVPLTLAPWEISSGVWITQTELARWAAGGPAAAWLAGKAPSWIQLWRDTFDVDGFNPFDTLGVAVVTRPDLLTCESWPIAVEHGPDDTTEPSLQGETPASKPHLVVDPQGSGRRARYCHTAAAGFLPDLMERVLRD
jgi:inosine-uridine nucleoside N-ribohydrolase